MTARFAFRSPACAARTNSATVRVSIVKMVFSVKFMFGSSDGVPTRQVREKREWPDWSIRNGNVRRTKVVLCCLGRPQMAVFEPGVRFAE